MLTNLECPKCKSVAQGTLERLIGVAEFDYGTDSYSGETDIYWDGQETEVGKDGGPILSCNECGNTWEGKGDWSESPSEADVILEQADSSA